MSIRLVRGSVALEPHDDLWDGPAKAVIEKLRNILKEDVVDIQHIGSTSFRSICAKPVIDIVVGVDRFDKVLQHNDSLEKQGIIFRGQDVENQYLYVLGDFEKNIRTHHIHVVLYGKIEWQNYINFRDYLNAHDDEAIEYAKLKERLAQEYPE